jgi:hypothetical protein
MDSRNLSTIEFDRFTLHTKLNADFKKAVKDKIDEIERNEKDYNEEIIVALATAEADVAEARARQDVDQQNIAAAEQQIEITKETIKNVFLGRHESDYKKLGIFYAFGDQRDLASALKYLNKYKSCIKDQESFEYAEALALIGYAGTIHPDFGKKEGDEKDLVAALELFTKLRAATSDESQLQKIDLQIQFVKRYLTLIKRRRNELDEAVAEFKELLAAQTLQMETFPLLKVDVSEYSHLVGVTLIAQRKKEEALPYLKAAKKLQEEFIAETGAVHFIKWITGQSLGLLYGDLGDYDNAVTLLTETIDEQTAYYGDKYHADIAKSVCFLGEVHGNAKKYSAAILRLLEGIDIKSRFYKAGEFVLTITQKYLIGVLKNHFGYDWNDYRTLAANEGLVPVITDYIASLPAPELLKLNPKEAQIYSQLLFKRGAYAIHVQNSVPDNHLIAQKYFEVGRELTTDKLERAWFTVHIAFCKQKVHLNLNKLMASYEALHAAAKAEGDHNQIQAALQKVTETQVAINQAIADTAGYYDEVINEFEILLNPDVEQPSDNIDAVKLVAFAYCIKGFTQDSSRKKAEGIESLSHANQLYKSNSLQNDGDQYARAFLRLANVLEENNRLAEAEVVYQILQGHWSSHTDSVTKNNLHEGKFHECYGNFLEKKGMIALAIEQFELACEIHETRKSPFKAGCIARIEKLRAKLPPKVEEAVVASDTATQSPAATLSQIGLQGSRARTASEERKAKDEVANQAAPVPQDPGVRYA